MSRSMTRWVAVLMSLTTVAVACSDKKTDTGSGGTVTTPTATAIDYTAIGLWDDGPCDTAKKPLVVGLMTVFESPVISLKDQATALEASATAFNKRGGANGSCIEVHVCDDGANPDKAVACVREIDQAGVVATINDQGTAAQGDVSKAMAEAKIPGCVQRRQRRLGRPERAPDRCIRHRRDVPVAPGARRRGRT